MRDRKSPAYAIPLLDDQLILLGKICAVMSQIDHFMSSLTPGFLKLGLYQYDSLLADKMISVRLNALAAGCEYISDKRKCEAVLTFVKKLRGLLQKRNLIIHGCWGEFTEDYVSFEAMIHSFSKPMVRFKADELQNFYEECCEVTALG